MYFRIATLALFFSICTMAPAQPDLSLELVVQGLSQPAAIRHAGDERLFIVERAGRIRILDGDGQLSPTPFLNIDPRVSPATGERGLLGLAFHPNYAANGYFFVNYINNNGNTHISRFQVSSGNPDQADPDSELVLMAINQPYGNHNGGDIHFGPDGYLYIGMGDGGSGGDPQNFSQNRTSLLGKMLRIDVDNGSPYSIPEDNPFAMDDFTLDEIWAIGLRNPWRFSFDRETGDMWMGDVGQNAWEEVSFQPANSSGGENYGWRCYEGFQPFNTNGCGPASEYTDPVYVYSTGSAEGCSITGGFVYRGSAYPSLYGRYIYSDFCSGRIWSLQRGPAGDWENVLLHNGPSGQYATFGEDQDGELYIAELGNGRVHRLTATCFIPGAPELSGAAVICGPNEPAALTAEGAPDGFVFNWYRDGDFVTETVEPSFSAEQPGSYQVQLAAFQSGNCDSPLSEPWAVTAADFPATLIFTQGDGLGAPTGFAAYQWFLDEQPVAGATAATFQPTSTGNYQVEVTDENGCSRRSETLSIVSTEAAIGLQSLTISPNPFRSQVQIALSSRQGGIYRLRLLSASGQVLWEQEASPNPDWHSEIDMQSRPAGLYFLEVIGAEGRLVRRLVGG